MLVADLSSGIYRAGLKGRVNNYLLQGVGIVNLSTDARLVTLPSGGFGITGRFAAQTVRIDNASARNILGGRTIVTGDIAVGPDAAVTVTRLRLAAPSSGYRTAAASTGRTARSASARPAIRTNMARSRSS